LGNCCKKWKKKKQTNKTSDLNFPACLYKINICLAFDPILFPRFNQFIVIESVELFFFVSFFKISLLNLYSFIQISKYLLHIHLLCIQRVRINCLNVTATVVIAFFCELLKSFAISWLENDNSRTRVGESYTKNKETEKKKTSFLVSKFPAPRWTREIFWANRSCLYY
jgi:hypothetical protein